MNKKYPYTLQVAFIIYFIYFIIAGAEIVFFNDSWLPVDYYINCVWLIICGVYLLFLLKKQKLTWYTLIILSLIVITFLIHFFGFNSASIPIIILLLLLNQTTQNYYDISWEWDGFKNKTSETTLMSIIKNTYQPLLIMLFIQLAIKNIFNNEYFFLLSDLFTALFICLFFFKISETKFNKNKWFILYLLTFITVFFSGCIESHLFYKALGFIYYANQNYYLILNLYLKSLIWAFITGAVILISGIVIFKNKEEFNRNILLIGCLFVLFIILFFLDSYLCFNSLIWIIVTGAIILISGIVIFKNKEEFNKTTMFINGLFGLYVLFISSFFINAYLLYAINSYLSSLIWWMFMAGAAILISCIAFLENKEGVNKNVLLKSGLCVLLISLVLLICIYVSHMYFDPGSLSLNLSISNLYNRPFSNGNVINWLSMQICLYSMLVLSYFFVFHDANEYSCAGKPRFR